MSGAALRFDYHRSVAPMMWVFVCLSGIDLVVVHALLSHWYPKVALVLSVLTAASILWLVSLIRSFRRLPVLIEDDALVLRVGALKSFRVPLSEVAGLRQGWTSEDLSARTTANLALIAWPNIWIDLAHPHGRRGVTAIAHKLDDADGFRVALLSRLASPDHGAKA